MSGNKDWDSPANVDDTGGSVVLPEGEYRFVVKSKTNTISKGSKTAGAHQASLVFMVYDINDETCANRIGTAYERLTLHDDTWGMVCSFFRAIGERKHGESIIPKWDEVAGASGKAVLFQDEYNGKISMKVKHYLFPDEEPAEPTEPVEPVAPADFG